MCLCVCSQTLASLGDTAKAAAPMGSKGEGASMAKIGRWGPACS